VSVYGQNTGALSELSGNSETGSYCTAALFGFWGGITPGSFGEFRRFVCHHDERHISKLRRVWRQLRNLRFILVADSDGSDLSDGEKAFVQESLPLRGALIATPRLLIPHAYLITLRGQLDCQRRSSTRTIPLSRSSGCVSGRRELVEMCRQRARPCLFSNTIPPLL
jgi:hypothetical protein